MNYILSLFIFIVVCNHSGISRNKNLQAIAQTSVINDAERFSHESQAFNLEIAGSDFLNEIPHYRKKRNKKGVKPPLFCFSLGSFYKINTFETKSFSFIKETYYFQPLLSDENRGPPAPCHLIF